MLKKGIFPRLVLAVLAAFAGFWAFEQYESATLPAPPAPMTSLVKPEGTFLQVTPSLSVKVGDNPPEDAELLCSKCLQPFLRKDGYVLPTYNENLKKYLGTYRCEKDSKPAIAETRARYAAHDSEEERIGLLDVLLARGVSKDQLRPFTSGQDRIGGINAVLDALENRKLRPGP